MDMVETMTILAQEPNERKRKISILTQFAYLGNIISITVDVSFFLSSPPFTVYLFPEFSIV
jgi:hypothetical protein